MSFRAVSVILALVAVLPVDAATVAAGALAPHARAAPPGDGPLVPGVPPGPHQPWQIDTPDQALPPRVYTPGAAEKAVEPRSAAAGTYDLIEYVPLSEAEAFAGADVTCTKLTGPYQRFSCVAGRGVLVAGRGPRAAGRRSLAEGRGPAGSSWLVARFPAPLKGLSRALRHWG